MQSNRKHKDKSMMDIVLPEEGMNLKQFLDLIELTFIELALERTNGNITHAAKLLGLKRTTLKAKLESKGLYQFIPHGEITLIEDPEKEFTAHRIRHGVWEVRYKGETIVHKRNIREVNSFMKEKISS